MTYIAIIGPMGSGKTTLAQELYNRLPDSFDLILNTEHKVFQWDRYLGKHNDPKVAWKIQNSMQQNHFHQIFGTFLENPWRDVISDSGFIEHSYYCAAKYAIGRYSKTKYNMLMSVFRRLNNLLDKPDVTIYVDTEPEQIIRNIQKRNRRGEKDRDMTEMLAYITELKRQYKEWDIVHKFGSDVNVTLYEVLKKIG